MDLGEEHAGTQPAVIQQQEDNVPVQQQQDNDPDQQQEDNDPVQQLSIQLLNLVTLRRVFPEYAANKNASHAIASIIKSYNEKLLTTLQKKRKQPITPEEKEKLGYHCTNEYRSGDYLVKTFHRCKSLTTVLARQQMKNPKETTIFTFILFFYSETSGRLIFALTSGDAWMVVRDYVDHSFPKKIAQKVADPMKIIRLERRCLFGEHIRESFDYPGIYELYKTRNLFYLVEKFTCVLKGGSSLSELIFKESKKKDRCWIAVTDGGILRIGKRLPTEQYPAILDLCTDIVQGKSTLKNGAVETVDAGFAALHFLKYAPLPNSLLDDLLAESIYSRWRTNKEQTVYVRHTKLEEYLLSNHFEIKVGTRFQKMASDPPKMKDILEKIEEHLKKKDSEKQKQNDGVKKDDSTKEKEFKNKFKTALKESKLKFISSNQPSEETVAVIIDCIEGQLHYLGNPYYKIRKTWYEIEADFLGMLCEDFKKLLQNHLIQSKKDKGYLQHTWKGHENKKKAGKQNSLVPDRQAPVLDETAPQSGETPESGGTALQSNGETPASGETATQPAEQAPPSSEKKNKRSKAEEEYCRSYLDVPEEDGEGFFVFDQICPDNIEPCDILKYTKDTIYLYHVKEKFGQTTRDATSQILNAATMIGNAFRANGPSPDYVKRLWSMAVENSKGWREKLKDRLEKFGETSFYNIFRDRKIVFVYAYLPDPEHSFANYLKRLDEPIDKILVEPLKNAGFLDSEGKVTQNLYITNQDKFVESLKPLYSLTQEKVKILYRRRSGNKFSRSTGEPTDDSDSLVEILKNTGFLDSEGKATQKLCCDTQKKFVESLKPLLSLTQEKIKKIYDRLSAGRFSRSTLAKIELIRLAQNLKTLGFDFKISEIPSPDDQSSGTEGNCSSSA